MPRRCSCQLIKTWMYSIRLQAPKLARKCEIKHWHACGADGRRVGWSVYGHVIAKFSRMDRFSIKPWGFELSPWSNKISAQNFKHYVTSIDRKMSPRSTQVMMVRVFSSLTAVNKPLLEWRIFELTDYECEQDISVRHVVENARSCTGANLSPRY